MIIPPAASCSGDDHEAGATCAAWMPKTPTPTNNSRIASFNVTIQISALPINSALNRFMPAIAITARLISACLPVSCQACGKNVAP